MMGRTLNKLHPLYHLWHGIRKRCMHKSCKAFKDYGAKGILVCNEWKNFNQFLKDMGPRPSKKHSIDRIDNSKGYYKENCRWATPAQQSANRRIRVECYRGHKWTKDNTLWTHNGRGKARRCRICLEKYLKTR